MTEFKICKIGHSKFKAYRNDNNYCIYHYMTMRKTKSDIESLILWIDGGLICQSTVKHVKFLIDNLSE